jgi:hypothetical protein
MISLSGIYAVPDLCMAGKAFFIGDFITQNMTLGAIAHPLQLAVCP